MFRRLTVLAFSALIALGGLAATTTPSAAGHRDRVSFGIGFGFDSGYVHFRSGPRYHHRYHRRHYSPYRHYYRPYYRHRAPVIYHQPRVRYYQPRVRYRSSGSHIEWCYARYRSYRAYDNTFQPYHGPRRQCRSPYS